MREFVAVAWRPSFSAVSCFARSSPRGGDGGAGPRACVRSSRPRSLLDLVRLLLFVTLTSYVYSWLKVALPLLRPDVLYDQGLFRLETASTSA